MRRKSNLLFLIFSLSLFTLAIILYWQSEMYSTFSPRDRDFRVDPDREVTRIKMKNLSEGNTIEIYKDEQDRWRLDEGYYANDLAVKDLLGVLERLSVKQPVSLANRKQVEELLQEKGVRVDIFARDYRVSFGDFQHLSYERSYQSMIVGPDASDGESTYMRKTDSDLAFRVMGPDYESGVSAMFVADSRVWRDPVVLDVASESVQSVQVLVHDNKEESFVLKPTDDKGFQFFRREDSGEALNFVADTARVRRFLSSFTDLHYERLLDEEDEKVRKELMFEQPYMEISVKSKDGEETHMKAFARQMPEGELSLAEGLGQDPNRFYLQVNEGEFALAQYFVFNRILRPLSFFKNKPADPSSD